MSARSTARLWKCLQFKASATNAAVSADALIGAFPMRVDNFRYDGRTVNLDYRTPFQATQLEY